MAEKYPLQIWVAARAGMSLTCAADLRSPEEKDMRNSPMEMHTRASVFRMAIASSQNGSVVANIPAKDVPLSISKKYIEPTGIKETEYSCLYNSHKRKKL